MITKTSTIPASPFVKWAGGKSQLINEISKRLPSANKQIRKYAEPFIGGGAVLFYILNNYDLEEVYISDINAELLNVYTQIKNYPSHIIEQLRILEEDFINLDKERRKEFYYKIRDKFNFLKAKRSHDIELASYFIFLNRTCFNGLYRVNRHGEYNVPMGDYKNPKICDENNILTVSNVLSKVSINCGSFELCDDFVDSNTFVYFDPPYRPLNVTSSFTSYTEGSFNDEDQIQLAHFFRQLDKKGAYLLESNSDPKNTNPSDEFFDELYKGFTIDRVCASRMINSKVSGRGQISELLIRNY